MTDNYYDPNDLIDEYCDPDDTGEDYSPEHPNSPTPPWD